MAAYKPGAEGDRRAAVAEPRELMPGTRRPAAGANPTNMKP